MIVAAWYDAFLCWIKTGVMWVVQQVIDGLGALWGVCVGLLPSMPDLPTPPHAFVEAMQFINFVFDVGWLLAWLVTMFGLWLALYVARVPLRWLKAAED